MIAGPVGTKTLRTLHMENIKQRALLYVAARFMMVKIDYCAKRQAASYKRQATSRKVLHRGAWIKFRAALRVGRD